MAHDQSDALLTHRSLTVGRAVLGPGATPMVPLRPAAGEPLRSGDIVRVERDGSSLVLVVQRTDLCVRVPLSNSDALRLLGGIAAELLASGVVMAEAASHSAHVGSNDLGRFGADAYFTSSGEPPADAMPPSASQGGR